MTTIFYDKKTIYCHTSGQQVDTYSTQKGVAIVDESVPAYITLIAGVKTDEASLAAALSAIE